MTGKSDKEERSGSVTRNGDYHKRLKVVLALE
jgi:hypothetical protein